jgi:hypothetical protein
MCSLSRYDPRLLSSLLERHDRILEKTLIAHGKGGKDRVATVSSLRVPAKLPAIPGVANTQIELMLVWAVVDLNH